ncbi:MAG: hypothetical protein PHW41_04470, partial [Eubacteriales bacterium]|nr:hypothetical protein [Eubacteriales bacterium]
TTKNVSVDYNAPLAHQIVETERANVPFSEMVYERPDLASMRRAIDDLQSEIDAGTSAQDLIDAYRVLQQQYDHADSMLSLIYLQYAFDVTDTANRDEYAYLQSALSELDSDMQDVSAAMVESSDEASGLAKRSLGERFVEAIEHDEQYLDASTQELENQDAELTLEYDNLSATFTLSDQGTDWTYEDIQNDMSLSNDEYYRLYDAFNLALNQQAGEIFLQQVDLRNEIATRLHYSDYSTYCYEGFGREYSPADARALHAAVKQYIAPIFIDANERIDTYDLDAETFSDDAFFGMLPTASESFSPKLREAVSYLLENQLYDVSDSAVKMDSQFTTYLSDYRAPFIFSTWTGSADDIATMLHELGHFTNYYYNAEAGNSAGENLDLAEVDSQALVLLLFDEYEDFYGDLADQARSAMLFDAMFSLLSGCMEDEFQQDVYENPDMTLKEMNALYKELAVDYGLDAVYGYQGTEWVLISHTFQYPLYYISYAVSMVPALELLELSQRDAEAAKTAYFNIMIREPYADMSEELRKNGLGDVFSEDTIARIADILEAYL